LRKLEQPPVLIGLAFDMLLRALGLGDVVVRHHPASALHRLVDDPDRTPVREFDCLCHGLAVANAVQNSLGICAGIA